MLNHGLGLVAGERSLEHDFAVGPGLAGSRFESDGQEPPWLARGRVDLCRGRDQTVTRLAGITGLQSVAVIPAEEQLVAVDHDPLWANLPVAADGGRFFAGHSVDEGNLQRSPPDNGEIVSGSVVVGVV